MNTGLKIETSYTADGLITQDDICLDQDNSMFRIIERRVLDTREKQIRDALIALGWIPPKS